MSTFTHLGLILACFSIIACSPTSSNAPTPPTPSASTGTSPDNGDEQVSFITVKNIMDQRCNSCHSQTPTQPGYSSPAGGVSYDTPAEIKSKASRIRARAVTSNSMPQGNVTNMTDEEREILGKWIEQGANL